MADPNQTPQQDPNQQRADPNRTNETQPTPTPAEIDAARLKGLGLDPETKEHEIPPGFEPANKEEKDKLQAKNKAAADKAAQMHSTAQHARTDEHTRAMAEDKDKAPYRTRSAQPEK